MYDLTIIGGGINGCALARLAARHNLKVLLLEKHDLARGASGNSSKLIHGGLRYLEQFDFPLVTESLNERKVLYQTAPHLVKEQRFHFPFYHKGPYWRWKVKLGLHFYDSIDKSGVFQRHKWHTKEELLLENPPFRSQGLLGAYSYSDCQTSDHRMVIENAVDAKKHGAEIKTYCEFEDLKKESDAILVHFKDRIRNIEQIAKTKKVAFCTGAWSNALLRKKNPNIPPPVLPSQGTHLYIKGLEAKSFFILPVPDSKRFFFVMPWKEGALVGTTEHAPHDHPDNLTPFRTEIDELQSLVMHYFPTARPQGICTFTGVRPLVRSASGSTVKTSRKHRCFEIAPGVGAILGGKYTTHRLMAEHFFQFLGFDLEVPLETLPLPGASNHPGEKALFAQKPKHLNSSLWREWIERYGSRALEILPLLSEEAKSPLEQRLAEVKFAIQQEFCRTPIDFLRRRSDLYFEENAGLDFFPLLEDLFEKSPEGSWKEHYLKLLEGAHHVAFKNCP